MTRSTIRRRARAAAAALALASAGCGSPRTKPTEATALPKSLRGGHVIEGVVYLDVNANGFRDPSEPSIPDLPVKLNGVVEGTTDDCGRFSFSELADGFHRVSVERGAMPAIWEGAPQVTQNVRAGKAAASALFEVALVPPPPKAEVITRTRQVIVQTSQKSAAAEAAALEAEKKRAKPAITQATTKLDRLRASGYAVLVQDTLKGAEDTLKDARRLIEIGDPASAVRLAGEATKSLDEARRRIEAETQKPLRW